MISKKWVHKLVIVLFLAFLEIKPALEQIKRGLVSVSWVCSIPIYACSSQICLSWLYLDFMTRAFFKII